MDSANLESLLPLKISRFTVFLNYELETLPYPIGVVLIVIMHIVLQRLQTYCSGVSRSCYKPCRALSRPKGRSCLGNWACFRKSWILRDAFLKLDEYVAIHINIQDLYKNIVQIYIILILLSFYVPLTVCSVTVRATLQPENQLLCYH